MISDTLITEIQALVRLLGAGLDVDGSLLTPERSALLRARIESGFALLHEQAARAKRPPVSEAWRAG